MMNYYLRSLIVLFIVTISGNLYGQLNYKDGYIITLQNDTLFGRLNDGGGLKNSRFCLFKTDKNSKAKKYYPADIKSYRFVGGKYYCSKKILIKDKNEFVFADVLLEGKINLYYSRKVKTMAYFINKANENSIGLVNKEVPVSYTSNLKLNMQNSGVYLDIYKDTLSSVFRDCRKILNQVENVGYNHKSLISISKAYIKETYKGTDGISYEKDLAIFKPDYGVFTGIRFSKIKYAAHGNKSGLLTSIPVGLFYNIPLPLINDRLSFQIEMIASNFNFKQQAYNMPDFFKSIEINSRMVSIPLLFKYEIAGNKLSPSIALGKETSVVFSSKVKKDNETDLTLHQSQKGRWLCDLGLDYKISPELSVFSTLRFQSNADFDYGISKTNFFTLYLGVKF